MIYKTFQKVSNVCQLLDKSKYPATTTINGVTFTNNGDGTITTSGTATSSGGRNAKIIEGIVLNPGKYYFYTYDSNVSKVIPCLSKSTDMSLVVSGNNTFTISKTVEVHFGVNVNAGNTYSGYFIPQLFDLTEMYGAGNEPTTVEQFRQDFPEEMYSYSPHCFVKSYKNTMICKTKNLFPTSTAVGTLSGWDQSTTRQFEEDKWYIGIAGSNYYAPENIIDYELTENYVYINGIGNGYGIGKAFKCEPNQTYTISCKWIENTNYMEIATGFYDENGNRLSSIGSGNLAVRHTFTTPANCKWFTVCFTAINKGSTYVYNIQLEKGSTATDFVPNGYIPSYKKSLICKTKNLFDIDKVFSAPTLCFDVSSLEIGKTYTFSSNKPIMVFKISNIRGGYNSVWNYPADSSVFTTFTFVMARDEHIPVTAKQYLFLWLPELYTTGDINTSGYVTDISQLNGYNLQIELGDTATDYVPYGHL